MKFLLFAIALSVSQVFATPTPAPTPTPIPLPASPPRIPGAPSGLPVDDPNIHKLISENLSRLETGEEKLELVEVKTATEQVVQGSLYEIFGTFKHGSETMDCNLYIWQQAWLDELDQQLQLKAKCSEKLFATPNTDKLFAIP